MAIALFMFPITLILIIVQVANAFGFLQANPRGVLYYGRVAMLAISASQFMVSIIDTGKRT